MYRTNTHIHSPHSFSAFDSVAESVDQALKEQIAVLGLSDFNTVDGYEEFSQLCREAGIYPLFCIEFIALSAQDKSAGLRWNDPQNPGAIYFCGKGLRFPVAMSASSSGRLDALWRGSQEHMRTMIGLLNKVSSAVNPALALDYETIKMRYARNTVRERHLARALADALFVLYTDSKERLDVLRKLFNDNAFSGSATDSVALQNELRGRLLKAGKPAYVEEDASAFLPLEIVREIILDAGGIPCYPVLADDSGLLNEREKDPKVLAATLKDLGIHAVEFIPTRNSSALLESYVKVLVDAGMCVTFGTEHNTPSPATLVVQARGKQPLSDFVSQTVWEGACLVAAHQELVAKGENGYVDRQGNLMVNEKERRELIELGAAQIGSVRAMR